MNVWRLVSLALLLALSACGGGGGGSTPGPQLTSLSFRPTTAYTGSQSGAVTLSGAVLVGAVDANGLQLTLLNASGTPVAQATGAIIGGPAQGGVSFSATFDMSTLPAGTYQIQVQATSTSGGTSNVVSASFQLIAYPWRSVSPMPLTVSEFAAAAVGAKAYVLTGLSTLNGIGTATASVQVYDTVSGQWSAGPQAPQARAGATATVVGTSIYVFGGYNAANPSGITAVDVLDTQTGTWSAGPAAPTARFYSCAAAIGSLIYVVDGTQSTTDSPSTAALERLDTTTGIWSTLAQSGFVVSHPGCTALNGSLYVNGGDTSSAGFSELIASQRYDPATNLWSTTNFFSINRSRHASVAVGGRVFIIGGRSDSGGVEAPTDTTEAFNPSSNSWSIRAPMPAAARDVRALAIGGVVYAFTPTSSYVYDAQTDLP